MKLKTKYDSNLKYFFIILAAEEEKQMFENITPIQKGNFQN